MIHPARIPDKPALGAADAGMREASGATYWESLAQAWLPSFEIPLWRTYCDRIHQSWIQRRSGPIRFARTLKTDLFEEALGNGLAEDLLRSSEQVVGIDVSPSIVSRASHRHPALQTRIADTRALPFPDQSFDRIVSISTLDHFESRAELDCSLRELVRVLAPGGHLFLTLDNPANPLIAARGLLPPGAFGHSQVLPYHVGPSMNARELRHALEALGLKVHDVTHLMHLPRILTLHLPMPPRRHRPAPSTLDARRRTDASLAHCVHHRPLRRHPRVRPGMTPANPGPSTLQSRSRDIPRNAAWTTIDGR